MEPDRLKKALEDLSEHELKRLELLEEITDMVEDTGLEQINGMPLLYRLELRKVLGEMGKDNLAARIDT